MKTIIFVLDCVRYDCFECNGNEDVYTPTIDKIAGEGVNFHKHYTVSPWTNPSVASLVTGIYPHKLNTFSYKTIFPPNTKNLFNYYNEQGGGNACFFKNFHFFGENKDINIIDYVWHTNSILQWLDQNNDKEFILYLHYWNTHLPYFTKYSKEGFFNDLHKIVMMLNSGEKRKIDKVKELYKHSIERASEEFIYAVIEKLDKLNSLDDTLVIITSDHGESFGEREENIKKLDVFGMHGKYLYDEILHIPLIIKCKNISGGININKLTRSIDILPTILELNGWELDENFQTIDGQSLLKILNNEESDERDSFFMTAYVDRFDQDIISESFEKYAFIKGDWKIIYDKNKGELYNLRKDPKEVNDLSKTNEYKYNELYNLLAHEINMEKEATDEEKEEIFRRLRDLGYID